MDTQVRFLPDLFLNESLMDFNYYLLENDPSKISSVSYNDAINDWLLEHVRRFNQTAIFLDRAVQQMRYWGEAINSASNEASSQQAYCEHRLSCRNVCFEIDVYVESYKAFLRYYLFMNRKETDNTKKWKIAIENYRTFAGWNLLEDILNLCEEFYKDKTYKFIKEVRDQEEHNESPIELMNYNFQEGTLIPSPQGYVLGDQELHNALVDVINKLLELTRALQRMLENVTPVDVFRFLETLTEEEKKYLIKPSDRYKKENEYVKSFTDLLNAAQLNQQEG